MQPCSHVSIRATAGTTMKLRISTASPHALQLCSPYSIVTRVRLSSTCTLFSEFLSVVLSAVTFPSMQSPDTHRPPFISALPTAGSIIQVYWSACRILCTFTGGERRSCFVKVANQRCCGLHSNGTLICWVMVIPCKSCLHSRLHSFSEHGRSPTTVRARL